MPLELFIIAVLYVKHDVLVRTCDAYFSLNASIYIN
jgi:hypothetical protein